ncbi:MAG: 3-oxoacyl-ACP reductase family protein [Patescibacteria group bacterium]|nr:3-oxoacyl-ACP reductase FabG [Patescibacteria group bacterium]
MNFKNKVVLVTGASKGIGKAIASSFAKEGAKVVVNYNSSKDEALEVVDEIKKLGTEAIAVHCDVTNEEDIKKMIIETVKIYNGIDILVNNAGQIIRPGDSNTDSDSWSKTLDINIKGVWLMIKYAITHMKNGSSIVNISSYVGQLGSQYVLPYEIAKAGVINLTKAYAKELAPDIRVNSVSPGNIDTSMTRGAGEEFIQKTISNTPLKRLGEPSEIAKAVLFLASSDASFITGVNLDVDGGFMLTN